MIRILFAPLQGITDAKFRSWHFYNKGGVDEYYTPFVRLEKGRIRDKDRRDLLPERNKGVPTVPQVIARDREEFARLCDAVQKLGWNRVDLNMGCPYPMQYNGGRGSGLLPHTDRVQSIFDEMHQRKDVVFSIKMRLGLHDRHECITLLPLINEAPLALVTMHPRLGIQQYKGEVDMDTFDMFYQDCDQPICYNGDIKGYEDIVRIQKQYPKLSAIMIGRALVEQARDGRVK